MSHRRFTEQIGKSSHPEFAGPHEGVPRWLGPSLMTWIVSCMPDEQASSRSRTPSTAVLRRLERELRLDPIPGDHGIAQLNSLLTSCRLNEDLLLDVVDWFIHQEFGTVNSLSVDEYFREAGSAYAVNKLGNGLVVRVSDEATAAAVQAASNDERAGHHLQEAWTATYGRKPNAGTAYKEAVKAVEVAAQPVITPDDEKATLGKMIQAITDKPDKWLFAISSRDGASRMESVGDMMAVLWQGQLRHGTPEPAAPFDNSQPEAEAAVHLSVTLVAWFAQGSISVVEAGR